MLQIQAAAAACTLPNVVVAAADRTRRIARIAAVVGVVDRSRWVVVVHLIGKEREVRWKGMGGWEEDGRRMGVGKGRQYKKSKVFWTGY